MQDMGRSRQWWRERSGTISTPLDHHSTKRWQGAIQLSHCFSPSHNGLKIASDGGGRELSFISAEIAKGRSCHEH